MNSCTQIILDKLQTWISKASSIVLIPTLLNLESHNNGNPCIFGVSLWSLGHTPQYQEVALAYNSTYERSYKKT